MPRQPYTSEYYESEIRKLYPAVQLLRAYCEANPEDESTIHELEKKKATLRGYRDKWAELLKKKALLEAEYQAVCGALGVAV